MKTFTSKAQITGEEGENEACKFLLNKDFKIIERNYTKKWGELDIVAKKANVIHFIEVKSIKVKENLSRENFYRPEENMSRAKIKKLMRVLETYLIERKVGENQVWQFDLVCVYLGENTKIDIIDNIILS